MRTNRPLYMTGDYRLTYDDGDLPTHYGFRVTIPLDRVQRTYRKIVLQGGERYLAGLRAARRPGGRIGSRNRS